MPAVFHGHRPCPDPSLSIPTFTSVAEHQTAFSDWSCILAFLLIIKFHLLEEIVDKISHIVREIARLRIHQEQSRIEIDMPVH